MSAARPPSKRRRLLYRILALALAPVLVLAGVEGVLRLAHFGYSTGFFDEITAGGRKFLVNNQDFSRRFFPKQLARWPGRIMAPEEKPAGTYRIFIMGESAAMGDPAIAYGAGRYLEVLLNDHYPGKHFQVINTGITAINSNVILPIARDCARRDGDLWIIYMGNNEMVGPFGAATVFGSRAPPLPLIRLSLALQRTRIGQLLISRVGRLGHRAPANWGGMEMFLGNQIPPGDSRREVVYQNFEQNTRDIVRAGLASGAKVLLNTVAVNLRDCPPFGSTEGANSASAQFSRAQDLLQAGNAAAARDCFQAACDLDTLPFRADSRINGAIKKVGGELACDGLRTFDAAAALAAQVPSDISGGETFYEHVHFNFDGNYRLGRLWAEQTAAMLLPNLKGPAAPWASRESCERWLGLTDWNRYAAFGDVLGRLRQAPFNEQSNNPRRVDALETLMKNLRTRMDASSQSAARQIYAEAIGRAPGDYFLHDNFASFLAAVDDNDAAIAQLREEHELVPQDFTIFSRMGGLFAREGNWTEAESCFHQALAQYPDFLQGWLGLGQVHAQAGNVSLALDDYQKAHRLDAGDPRPFYYIGTTLSDAHRNAEAIENFRQAIDLNSNYWEARFALGVELGAQQKIAEAVQQFQDVVRLNPNYALGHLNLAFALIWEKQPQAAERELQETLRVDPGNATALDYLRHMHQSP